MSDLAALITALVPLLTAFGGAVLFFLKRFDARVAKAERMVRECEQHRAGDQETIAQLKFEVHRDGWAIRMLFRELHEVSPMNATLGNVASVLRMTYDPALTLPDDFAELLASIERASRRAGVAA